MWCERYTRVCRQHSELVAVYESPEGRLGVLLRATIVPLADERREWMEATRRAVRRIVAELRAAGFLGGLVVLQWGPLDEAASVLRQWTRRYDGDPERREQLTRAVDRYVADLEFIWSRQGGRPRARSQERITLAGLARLRGVPPPGSRGGLPARSA